MFTFNQSEQHATPNSLCNHCGRRWIAHIPAVDSLRCSTSTSSFWSCGWSNLFTSSTFAPGIAGPSLPMLSHPMPISTIPLRLTGGPVTVNAWNPPAAWMSQLMSGHRHAGLNRAHGVAAPSYQPYPQTVIKTPPKVSYLAAQPGKKAAVSRTAGSQRYNFFICIIPMPVRWNCYIISFW